MEASLVRRRRHASLQFLFLARQHNAAAPASFPISPKSKQWSERSPRIPRRWRWLLPPVRPRAAARRHSPPRPPLAAAAGVLLLVLPPRGSKPNERVRSIGGRRRRLHRRTPSLRGRRTSVGLRGLRVTPLRVAAARLEYHSGTATAPPPCRAVSAGTFRRSGTRCLFGARIVVLKGSNDGGDSVVVL